MPFDDLLGKGLCMRISLTSHGARAEGFGGASSWALSCYPSPGRSTGGFGSFPHSQLALALHSHCTGHGGALSGTGGRRWRGRQGPPRLVGVGVVDAGGTWRVEAVRCGGAPVGALRRGCFARLRRATRVGVHSVAVVADKPGAVWSGLAGLA